MRYCENCGELLKPRKNGRLCSRACKEDYYHRGLYMRPTTINILNFIVEERGGGPVVLEMSENIYSITRTRSVPLLDVRETLPDGRCIVEINAKGMYWYEYHKAKKHAQEVRETS